MKATSATATALLLFLAVACCAEPLSAFQDDHDQFLDSGGVKIRYRVVGDGTPVILIHGFAMTIESNWDSVMDSISDAYQLIALDLRGHGKSDKPHNAESYGMETVHDLSRLLDHLGIQSAHLVGYSFGAHIAMRFAVMHPERVRTLVVGGAGFRERTGWQEQAVRFAEALRATDDVANVLAPSSRSDVPSELVPVFSANDGVALAAFGISTPVLILTEDELASIRHPLLAPIGGEDPRIAEVRAMESIVEQVEVVVIDGHVHGNAFNAAEFADAIERFLNGADG